MLTQVNIKVEIKIWSKRLQGNSKELKRYIHGMK